MTRARKAIIALAILAGLVPGRSTGHIQAASRAATGFKAVAFDYFVLFNPDSVVREAEEIFPWAWTRFHQPVADAAV